LLQTEVDNFILLLAAEVQLMTKPLHLGLELFDLLFVCSEARMKLLLQGHAQTLLDLVAIRFVPSLFPVLDQLVDYSPGICSHTSD